MLSRLLNRMTVEQAINLGLQRHRSGNLAEAEAIYRQVLSQQPNHAEALHLLGLIAQQSGKQDVALELITRAVHIAPNRADFFGSLGLTLQELKRLDQSISAYQQAIALNPNLAQAHNNLGNVLMLTGRLDEAEPCFVRAMVLQPGYPDPHFNLGRLHSAAGRLKDAASAYRQALSLRRDWPQALNNLGAVLHKQGQRQAALECFQKALAASPDYVDALNNLGDLLCEVGQAREAVAACRRAVQLRPDIPEAHNNLGNALCAAGHFDQAVAEYRRALALNPEYTEAFNNLGNAYQSMGDLEQAVVGYRTALALRPDHPSAHWNMGLVHLMRGEFEKGWPEYEWRLKMPNVARLDVSGQRWDGGDLAGRRILLHAEQALGDTIQFFRYAEFVRQRNGTIVLAVQEELLRLLAEQPGIEQCVNWKTQKLPDFDVHFPLASLPGLFKTTMETIPASVPYIVAHAERVAAWKPRVDEAARGRRKVGLLWAGRSFPDPFRAVPPAELAGLATIPGNWFCSLQTGEGATQSPPPGLELTDWTKEFTDLADTAALMANLDLIITVDTSVAHLAGAMGKPVWVILKRVPDWRWMLGRADCAWYPTMRLFRQEQFGDFKPPVAQVVEALRSS
jgi:tetratricopeptide (TPR) repeat protein